MVDGNFSADFVPFEAVFFDSGSIVDPFFFTPRYTSRRFLRFPRPFRRIGFRSRAANGHHTWARVPSFDGKGIVYLREHEIKKKRRLGMSSLEFLRLPFDFHDTLSQGKQNKTKRRRKTKDEQRSVSKKKRWSFIFKHEQQQQQQQRKERRDWSALIVFDERPRFMSWSKVYWVLPGFSRPSRFILGVPVFFLGFTGLHWVKLDFVGIFSRLYWVSLDWIGFYRVFLDYTEFLQARPFFSRFYCFFLALLG